MRYFIIVLSFVFSSQVFAFASTGNFSAGVITGGSSEATAGSTASTKASTDDKKDKIVRLAKNDAAAFLASNGNVRGVYLETAIQYLRQDTATKNISDTQLAEAILAY